MKWASCVASLNVEKTSAPGRERGVERSGIRLGNRPAGEKARRAVEEDGGMRTGEGEEDRDDDRAGGEPATGGRARSLVRV